MRIQDHEADELAMQQVYIHSREIYCSLLNQKKNPQLESSALVRGNTLKHTSDQNNEARQVFPIRRAVQADQQFSLT